MLSDWEKSHWKGRRNSHRQCTGTCTFATNQTFRHHRKFECTKFCFSLLLQKSNKNCFHIKKHTKNALIPVPQYQVILVFKIDFISFAGSICKQRIYDKSAKSPIDTTLTHQTWWIFVLWRQGQTRGKNTKIFSSFLYMCRGLFYSRSLFGIMLWMGYQQPMVHSLVLEVTDLQNCSSIHHHLTKLLLFQTWLLDKGFPAISNPAGKLSTGYCLHIQFPAII